MVVDDESLLQWGFKALGGICLTALGWVWRAQEKRITTLESRVNGGAESMDQLRRDVVGSINAHARESADSLAALRAEVRGDLQDIRQEMNAHQQTILQHLLRGSPRE